MRCRSRIFSSSTKNKMKTLDPQIKTCTSVIWVVFVTLTKWESNLRLLAEQYYFCDELLPSPNDFGQSNFLWKWSWWRNLPSLTWLLHEVSSEKFDFSLVFFYFYFRCCFVEKIKFPLRNAFNFSGWKTCTTLDSRRQTLLPKTRKRHSRWSKTIGFFLMNQLFWAKSKKSKNWKEFSFLIFDFLDSAQKTWVVPVFQPEKLKAFLSGNVIFSTKQQRK